MKKKDTTTENIPQKKPASERIQKALAFCKRYWYWFVTIPVLIGVVIGWCFGMGYFSKKEAVTQSIEQMSIYPGSYYVLDVDVARKDVEINVREGYEDFIEVKENVLYAKKEGNAYVNVKNGSTETTYLFHIEPRYMNWYLATGDTVPSQYVKDLGNKLFLGAVSVTCSDYRVFEETVSGGDNYYEAKSAGYADLFVWMDNVYVCHVFVTVEDDMPEEKKYCSNETAFLNVGEQAEQEMQEAGANKTRKEMTINLGETSYINDLSFSGGGSVYFRSSSDRVSVYQNGVLFANMPGTATITVACIAETGMDFYRIKVNVPVQEVEFAKTKPDGVTRRPVYVGETITQEELVRTAHQQGVVVYESESATKLQLLGDDPYEFKAVGTTEKDAIINAYFQTEHGLVLAIRYRVEIRKEGEEEDDE